MIDAVLAFIVAALLLDRFLLEYRNRRDRKSRDELATAVIGLAERTNQQLAVQAEEARAQVSEMATRIQHPQIMRPDIRPDEEQSTGPVYDDDYDLVGKVFENADSD